MILLFFFVLLSVAFAVKSRPSPAWLLIAVYLCSLVFGVLLGNDYHITSTLEYFNLFFVAVILTLLIVPWKFFPFSLSLAEIDDKKVCTLTRVLLAMHLVGFVVFSIACCYAFVMVKDYSAFRDGEGIAAFNQGLPIDHTLHLLVTYFNWTAIFLVPLHLYHLLRRRVLLAILSVSFSLNIVLEGVAVFSRSTIIIYFMLYVFYLPFFYKKFSRVQRRISFACVIAVFVLCGLVFHQITRNRFADYKPLNETGKEPVLAGNHKVPVLARNPEVLSIIDYASQWYRNGNFVMARYSFETLSGELSLPLITTLANKVGVIKYPADTIPRKLKVLWGNRWDRFVGLVPNLVFDVGYSGTVLAALVYAWLLRRMRPNGGAMHVSTLLVLGPLFLLPAMGFTNSMMKNVGFNLLLLYCIAVSFYLSPKRPRIPQGQLGA